MTKLLALCAIFFIVSFTDAFEPIPVNFLYKSDAVLDCTSTGWSKDTIKFYRVTKDGEVEKEEEVVEFEDEQGHEKVDIDDGVLTLKDLRNAEITPEYYCKSSESDEKQEFTKQIEPFLMVPEKQSFTVTEGGTTTFKCHILYGNDNEITWSWTHNNTSSNIEASDDITITSNQTQSVLIIKNVDTSHKGDTFCVATNKFGSHSAKFTLRVKDMLAALWPILAIVAEVLILCIIIFIYEKKCSKKPEQPGLDNEQSENLMGKDSQGDLKKRNIKA